MIKEILIFSIQYFYIIILIIWLATLKDQLDINNKYNNNK